MQVLKGLYGVNIYGCAVKLKRAFEGIDETTKHRREVIDFYQEYGKRATLDAFGISKSMLYNWLKSYREYGMRGLKAGSRAPIHKRGSEV